jgi:hypothetical protein
VWSRNRKGLYIQDALIDFAPDLHNRWLSPPAQYKMYKQRLLVTQFSGFGGGGSAVPGDLTSYRFFGTSDWISIPDTASLDHGSAAAAIDLWVYADNTTGNQTIITKRADGTVNGYLIVLVGTDIQFYASTDGISWDIASAFSMGTMSSTTWTHLAWSRAIASNIKAYKDGSLSGTITTSATINANSELVSIGGEVSSNPLEGRIDQLRISDVDRFPNAFTPSVNTYTVDGNTLFLLSGAEAVVSGSKGTDGWTALDTSGNHTITGHGVVDEDTVVFKI